MKKTEMISRFSPNYKAFHQHTNELSSERDLFIGVLWVKWEMAVSILVRDSHPTAV